MEQFAGKKVKSELIDELMADVVSKVSALSK